MKPSTSAAPHVIIMVGIPGSGKTTFAERFAETFKAPFINPVTISDHLESDADITEKVTSLLFSELLKTNRTIVYEGSTYTKEQRKSIAKLIAKDGYLPLIVWVQTEPVEAKRRAMSSKKKGTVLSPKDFDIASAKFQPPTAKEKPVVISGKHLFGVQAKSVLRRLVGDPATIRLKGDPSQIQRAERSRISR